MEQNESAELKDSQIGFSPEGRFKRKPTDKIHNGLKCYEIIDGEITAFAFVNTPAHGVLSKMSVEDRQIIGPVLVPNKMIYRINPLTGEEYYIYFTADVISKFHKQNWSKKERFMLANLFSQGKSEKEIALELSRDEQDVIDRIKQEGEMFRIMVIMIMSQNNQSTKTMAERLKISEQEVFRLVNEVGGQVIRK